MWLDWDNQTRADQAGGCWHGPAAHVTTTQHSVVWSPQLSRAYPVANQSDKEDDDADESTKAQKGSEKKKLQDIIYDERKRLLVDNRAIMVLLEAANSDPFLGGRSALCTVSKALGLHVAY